MKVMHALNWVNRRLNIELDDLARITIFGFLQIGLMLSLGLVEFHYPPGHWMRGFACVPLAPLFVAVLEFAMRDEERLGNSVQIMLSVALMTWTTINSSLEGSAQFKHLLGALLAMEVAVLSRLLQPSYDDVRGQMGRWGRHWYAFSDNLPWILAPAVGYFVIAYLSEPELAGEMSLEGAYLFTIILSSPIYYKIVVRDWIRMVRLFSDKTTASN
jgi:hypothetical protein